MFTSEKMVKFLQEKYPPGTRIRLVSMEDPYGKKNSQPTQVPVAERRSPYSAMGLYNEDAKT